MRAQQISQVLPLFRGVAWLRHHSPAQCAGRAQRLHGPIPTCPGGRAARHFPPDTLQHPLHHHHQVPTLGTGLTSTMPLFFVMGCLDLRKWSTSSGMVGKASLSKRYRFWGKEHPTITLEGYSLWGKSLPFLCHCVLFYIFLNGIGFSYQPKPAGGRTVFHTRSPTKNFPPANFILGEGQELWVLSIHKLYTRSQYIAGPRSYPAETLNVENRERHPLHRDSFLLEYTRVELVEHVAQISLSRTPAQGTTRQMTPCYLLLCHPLRLDQPSGPPPAKFCMGALMSKGSTETQLWYIHWQSHAQDSGLLGDLFCSIKAPRTFLQRARNDSQYWSRRLVPNEQR